jgi:hypothetical protein
VSDVKSKAMSITSPGFISRRYTASETAVSVEDGDSGARGVCLAVVVELDVYRHLADADARDILRLKIETID